MTASLRGALVGVFLVLTAASGIRAQRLTYTGAASYSGGTYIFDTRSDSWVLSNGLRLSAGPFTFGASVPLLAYNGGLVTTVTSGVPLPTGGTQTDAVRDRNPGETIGTRGKGKGGGQGPSQPAEPPVDTVDFVEDFRVNFGDPVVSAEGEVFSGFGFVRSVSLMSSTKIPLADVETGISSGAWDLGAGASAIFAVGPTLVLADLSYWWIGDMPDLELNDGLSYALAVSAPVFAGRGSVMGLISGLSQTIDTMDPPITVTASLSRSFGTRGFGSASLGVGLTESAPDLYVSAGWSIRVGPSGP
jgi:hypothetical protein